jgi:antitoxin component YwqK of YwqJK toxin-antitoxin module
MMTFSRFTIASTLAASLGLLLYSACPQLALGQEAATTADDAVYLDEPVPPPKPIVSQEGPTKEEYEPGKSRVERHVRVMSDNTIVNHGKFTEFYRNGQKFADGDYENGVLEGSWSYWHENGQLSKTVNFAKGQPDGAWDVFRADGTLLAKRGYKNGKRDGKWVAYFEDGKTASIEQEYADGELNGMVTIYFKSGKPRIQTPFKNNLREGRVTEWDESGRKIAEADYVAGKREGELIRYAPDGTATKEIYKDDKRVAAGQ